MPSKQGIYLVANLKSQEQCENLIYSIRKSGCSLPIRLIHYGGEKVNSPYVLSQVELVQVNSFSKEAIQFIDNLQSVLKDCPRGFLYRFLAWFSDWDEFIYSDNDIVALMNWENLFHYLSDYDLVHSDEEYLTEGKFNHYKPQFLKDMFGEKALEKAFTAGHFVSKRSSKLVYDIDRAVDWFKQYPDVPKKHDQALLHVAALIGDWNMLNLCKYPNNWLTTWASDYKNPLDIIQAIQFNSLHRISHLHFSGRKPDGIMPIDDLLFSSMDYTNRLKKLAVIAFQELSGIRYFSLTKKRAINYLARFNIKKYA